MTSNVDYELINVMMMMAVVGGGRGMIKLFNYMLLYRIFMTMIFLPFGFIHNINAINLNWIHSTHIHTIITYIF